MGANLVVFLDPASDSGLPANYQYEKESYGFTLVDYLDQFDQTLKEQSLQTLSSFRFEDPNELQDSIAGLESVGLDASKEKARLASLKGQKTWHTIKDGLLSFQAALRFLDNPPWELERALGESMEELEYDLKDALEILQRAQHKGGKRFRLQQLD